MELEAGLLVLQVAALDSLGDVAVAKVQEAAGREQQVFGQQEQRLELVSREAGALQDGAKLALKGVVSGAWQRSSLTRTCMNRPRRASAMQEKKWRSSSFLSLLSFSRRSRTIS